VKRGLSCGGARPWRNQGRARQEGSRRRSSTAGGDGDGTIFLYLRLGQGKVEARLGQGGAAAKKGQAMMEQNRARFGSPWASVGSCTRGVLES
jgi:hypothetical protein